MRIGLCGTGGFAREAAPLAAPPAEAAGVCFVAPEPICGRLDPHR